MYIFTFVRAAAVATTPGKSREKLSQGLSRPEVVTTHMANLADRGTAQSEYFFFFFSEIPLEKKKPKGRMIS